MTIGPGQLFENFVVHLLKTNANRTPRFEQVGISRANDINCLNIDNRM